jgi:ribosomal protein S18 acetylase RimI-like enzyme
MMQIEPLRNEHLIQLQALINAHLSAVVPGWALPAAFIADRLHHDPRQYVLDPWVTERTTLCALDRQRVVAAAHVLRYGTTAEVGEYYRGAGDIAWVVFWPEHAAAAPALLSAVHSQLAKWRVTRAYAWDTGLPIPLLVGVPDAWPHVAAALAGQGYRPFPDRAEALYGGRLDGVPVPFAPPIAGLALRRTVGSMGARFSALVEGQEVGHCDCGPDLTLGGELPALRGWAELFEIEVEMHWRNRGIGTWLVQHAAAWLRLGGCDRIVLAVASEDEAAGAGRFYRRFGWEVLVREQPGWSRAMEP